MNQQRDMNGILFNNDKKQTDAQPDKSGSCTINGQRFWVSGWLKEGKNGTFLSLAFKPMEDEGNYDQTQRQPSRPTPKKQQYRSGPTLPKNDPKEDIPPF